jgi:plastocyanin
MHAHRTSRSALALVAVLALAACGETTRTLPTSKATPRPVPSVPATVNPAPSPSATVAPSESGSASPSASATGGSGNAVEATAANKFVPAKLTVKKGTTVTWTSNGAHTANSGTPPTVDKAGPIQADYGFTTLSVTFDKPGTYKYFCVPHGGLGMTGEIVVT